MPSSTIYNIAKVGDLFCDKNPTLFVPMIWRARKEPFCISTYFWIGFLFFGKERGKFKYRIIRVK